MPMDNSCTYSVAIFAYNEEDQILECLRAVEQATQGVPTSVYVLANGCSDRTADKARTFCDGKDGWHVAEIELGDKANAWNEYVYNLSGKAKIHFFIDADTRPGPESFNILAHALERNSYAHAASGVPESGRTAEPTRQNILRNHGMPGPLYSIREEFLSRLRAANARLPLGLIGDDIIVPVFVKTNLFQHRELDLSRVVPCSNAVYAYYSLSYARAAHWRLYWRRRARNSLRHFQNQLLIPRLRRDGLAAMPTHIEELYTLPEVSAFRPRREFPNYLFDRIALARIKEARRARSSLAPA